MVLLYFLTFLFTAQRGMAANGDYVNAVEFSHMCAAFHLATGTPPLPWVKQDDGVTPLDEAKTFINEIYTMEMALVPKEISEQISEKSDYEKDCSTETCKNQISADKWNLFKEIKSNVKAKQGTDDRNDNVFKSEDPQLRDYLRKKVQQSLKNAEKLKSEIKTNQDVVIQKHQEAVEKLREAAFGAAEVAALKQKPPAEMEALKTPTDAAFSTKGVSGGACGTDNTGSGTDAGKSIVSDMVCICAVASNPDGDKVICTSNNPTLGGNGYDGAANGRTIWTGLIQACKAGTETGITYGGPTPHTIREAIATFQGDLGKNGMALGSNAADRADRHGGRYVLGVYASHSSNSNGLKCTGALPTSSQNVGVCVNYVEKFKAGLEIPWVGSLRKAAAALEDADTAYQKAKRLVHRIEQIALSTKQQFTTVEGIFHLPVPRSGSSMLAEGKGENRSVPVKTQEKDQTLSASVALNFST